MFIGYLSICVGNNRLQMKTVGLITKKCLVTKTISLFMHLMLLWFQNETENVGHSWYKTKHIV